MESLRDKLLDVISTELPETPEVLKWIEEGKFGDMLDKVMDKVSEHITECLSDEIK